MAPRRRETETEIWCSACQEMHLKSEFCKDKNSRTGLNYSCRKVTSERSRVYHEKHKARINQRHKERRAKIKTSPNRIEWALKKMVQDARRRANDRGLEFNLSYGDLIVSKTCPVFGWALVYQGSGKRSHQSASLDRIDPGKGYTIDNVWIISWRANQVKLDSTVAELRAVANAIEKLNDRRSRTRLVGAKAAGHLLDGRLWEEMPE